MNSEPIQVTMDQFLDMAKSKENILEALSIEGYLNRLFDSTGLNDYFSFFKANIIRKEKTSDEKPVERHKQNTKAS